MAPPLSRAVARLLTGREAIRFEWLTDDGTEVAQYGYVIEDAGRAYTIFTTSNQGVDYSAWKRIVDEAVETFELTTPVHPRVEGADVVPPQVGLPEAVARKRAEIWLAARARDYAALNRLVDPAGFEYTFGGPVPGGPAAYWRRIDQTTDERPLETLAAILELPYVHQERFDLYVWPFAFTRRAGSLDPEEREQLREAIGEESLRAYEQLGNYLGYRAGIDEDGEWVFYVAGD